MVWTERFVDQKLRPISNLLVPEFNHASELSGSGVYRYDWFRRPTQYMIGDLPISSAVLCTSELDEEKLEIFVGVQVPNTDWIHLVQHNNVMGALDISGTVNTYTKSGIFDNWAKNMQQEYKRGLEFTEVVKGAFSTHFPFDNVTDQYGTRKRLVFSNLATMQAVEVCVENNRFDISVPEIEHGVSGPFNDVIEIEGALYNIHDRVAVWYPTLRRQTIYDPVDKVTRSTLLNAAIEEVDSYLKRSK